MVFPFTSKKRPEEPKKAYVPVNLVQRYASQGMPENEIAARLRDQGFSPGQIDAAIRSVLRERVAGPSRAPPRQAPPTPMQAREQYPSMQMPARETGGPAPAPARRAPPQPERRPEPAEEPRPRLPMQAPPSAIQVPEPQPMERPEPEMKFTFEEPESRFGEPGIGEVTLEEIVEGIVAEKWQDFEERLSNFEERDLQLQGQIEDIRHSLKDITKMVEAKEQDLSSRFEDFSGSMSEIQGRIGSIETVFKEFVPELTRSVKALSEKIEK